MNTRTTDRHPSHGHRRDLSLGHSEVRVALVVAACLLVEAIIAKNVLDVQLGFFSQFGALWVWIAYTVVGRRDRAAELATMLAAVFARARTLLAAMG